MARLRAVAVGWGLLLAVGVNLAGLCVPVLPIAVPAGIIAWACFYAAGGKTQGLQKAIAATVSGVVWVLLAHLLISALGLQSLAWIVIGVVAFLIVMQSRIPALSFIPGRLARAAAATPRRAGTHVKPHVMVAIPLVAGPALAYPSQ